MRIDAQPYDYRLSHVAASKGASYDASFSRTPWRAFLWQCESRAIDRILQEHFTNRAPAHLDFACGTGRILGHVCEKARISVGVDVSDSMLAVARRNVPSAQVIHADLTREHALGERTFDLITAFRFFPNAQPELRSEALQSLAAHLAPGGLLVFNNHKNHSSMLYTLGRLLGKRPTTMSRRDVSDLLSDAGLETVETFAMGLLPASDRHMVLPRWVHGLADGTGNALGLGRRLAQNLIYVCRKNSNHEAGTP